VQHPGTMAVYTLHIFKSFKGRNHAKSDGRKGIIFKCTVTFMFSSLLLKYVHGPFVHFLR